MAYMSEEGYKKLVAELQYLEGVRRPEIIQQIAEARERGPPGIGEGTLDSILVTVSGIVTFVKLSQFLNALGPILVT